MTDSRSAEAALLATEQFRQLATDVVDEVLQLRPEYATTLGDHRFDDRLDARDDAELRRESAALRARLQQLLKVDVSSLPSEDRVDHAMLTRSLDRRVFEIEVLAEHLWNPLAYNVGESLYPLLARAEHPAAERLRGIAGRLMLVPELVETATRQLTGCPRVHLETMLMRHDGVVAMVRDEVSALLADEPGLKTLVEPAQARALDALERLRARFDALMPAASDDFRLGAEKFEKKLGLVLHSPLTAADVVRRAQTRLAEVQELLYAACRDFAGSGRSVSVREVLDEIAAQHPDDDTIVPRAAEELRAATDAASAYDLVTIPADPVEVQVMPEFRRGVAGAYCDAPGPFESGGHTFFAIAPPPAEWPAERRESFYREVNDAMLVDLVVHEAMPGHAVQLAHARRFAGPTPVRKAFWSGSFVEGWAVHAEELMADRGHGGLRVRTQQLKMQIRMVINAILDHGVHATDMTAGDALHLMQDEGYQEEGEALGKWRRACMSSTQLSTYFVGYTELADVLGRARVGRSDREVHDALLAHGSPPPSLIDPLL